MAMIVNPLVSQFAATLAAVMKEEVGMIIDVKDELQTLGKKVDTIRTVLEDAEHRVITNPAIRVWISDLKNVIYDADDIIDECRTHYESSDRSTHCSCCYTLFSSFDRIGFRHQAGSRIRGIKERLERIIKDQSDLNLIAAAVAIRDDHRGGGGGRVHRQTDPGLEPDIVGIGIESNSRNLVRLLTAGEYLSPTVLAIVGMGGIGKTTLAQKIYNHPTIRDCFRPMWVCVSQDYSDTALLREVIRAAGGNDPGVQHDRSFAELQGLLTQVIEQKRFLLILDDVWSAQAWERLLRKPLLHGAVGSRILITTRDERVAREMGAVHLHAVKPLSTNDGCALLCRMVFGCGGEGGGVGMMEDIGMQIVERCHGLPLAIKTIAGVLRTKERTSREWEKVLQNPAWEKVLPDGVMGVLYLSYQDLPFHLKQCFIYCSLFREDYVFTQGYIIGHWLAQGFVREEGNMNMVEVAEEYYMDLVGRSLLQPDPRFYANQGCKMHDLLRDLAQFLARDENFVGEMDGLVKAIATSSKLCHLSITDYMISQKKMDHKCLRTLMLTDIPLIADFPEDLFSKLGRLRVLDFRSTPIERLPKSVGNLRQLRYLNLSYSLISELPETIGSLSNLLYLILEGCKNLHNLPKGIVKLYNLRGFNLVGTPVTGMPVGLRGLQNLTSLIGFVTNEGNIGGGRGTKMQIPSDGWCSLEDLGYLSQLRRLVIHNLERSLIRTNSRGVLLKDKRHLSGLTMHSTPCKTDGKPYDDEEVKQIQKVFEEELFPPPSLEFLEIYGYFGLQFPSWMMTSSIVSALCNLRRMDLVNFHLCKQLPPLGLLSNLDYFHINCATAVESIGPEFLGLADGGATWDAQTSFSNISFPKLESLEMVDMPDWVEWLWEVKDGATAMPCLQKLYLNSCPKLRSLPTGLRHATALQSITIKSANSLRTIENLASVKIIILKENPSLVRISNLPALQRLSVNACPALREVEGLNSLTSLVLQDLAMDILPDWLLPKEGGKHPFPSLAKLKIIVGGVHMLRRFVEGGPDWSKIHHFQDVYIETNDTTNFVSYTRDPFTFRTNQDYAGECSGNDGGADVDRRI